MVTVKLEKTIIYLPSVCKKQGQVFSYQIKVHRSPIFFPKKERSRPANITQRVRVCYVERERKRERPFREVFSHF